MITHNFFGSTVGKWTCYIPPIHRPRITLHLFRKQHPGTAYYDSATGETSVVPNMEVTKFTLVEAPEGDFAPGGPALECGDMENNEVFEFLQAVVNEAAKFGIYAAGTKDITRELTATKAHLEDMRRLALEGTRPVEK